MEDFTCWWHPLDNLTEGEEAAYVLTYSKDKGPTHECPDYVTAGPNSCHFDSSHTSVWKMYCMAVTAITARGNFTSQEHCLDVADIVQTEAPVNLAYTLTDAGGDEMGHNVQLSWTYPVPSHLKYGWITLVYELQYRRANEHDKWKAKQSLREPHVKLLGLPVGDYVIRVRCRSHNYGLWSKWSATLQMSIPSRVPAGKLLVLILVTGVGVVALLVIAFGVLPQSRRFKEYFLPQIPKPRIIGIDPLFLKKGNLEEVNRHFSNFHSYKPPSYSEEVWDEVSADSYHTSAEPTQGDRDASMVPNELTPVEAHQLATSNPSSYVQSPLPYSSSQPQAFAPLLDTSSLWPRPEMVSLPGTDYTVMGHPESVPAPDATASRSPQDLYTCVQLMNESGEVHLMPCVLLPYCQEFPPLSKVDLDQAEKEEKKKLANYLDRKNMTKEDKGGDETERSDATVPLLPVALGNKG
ncbi:prolactin receptor isoform X2 [Echeneis naucrates]|nr:prolactin receptor-like isoform X2 [Echeneis naucrates]